MKLPFFILVENIFRCSIIFVQIFLCKNFCRAQQFCTPGKTSDGSAKKCPGGSAIGCWYNCKSGYIFPQCITPFAKFLETIGGPWVFAMGVGVTSVLFAIVFGVVCKRVEGCSVYQQRQKFIRLEGLQRMPGR